MIPGSAALLCDQRRTRKNAEPRLAFSMVHVAVISNARLWQDALCSLLDQSKDGLHVLGCGEFHHFLELMAKEPDVAVLDAGHSVNRDLVRRTLATLSGRLAVVAGTGENLRKSSTGSKRAHPGT